jgi:hypothetical protein
MATKTCVECGERPALGVPKKTEGSGRMFDTCGPCLVKLAAEGVDITQPKPKPPTKSQQKAAERESRIDLIEQRAQARKRTDQEERGIVPEAATV